MTTAQAKNTWDAVLGELQLQVTRPSYETWLKDTVGLARRDDELVVGTPNTFVAEMLEQRMYSLISRAAERVTKSKVDVRFQVTPHGAPRNGTAELARSAVAPGAIAADPAGDRPELGGLSLSGGIDYGDAERQPFRAAVLNSGYTFASFIVGKSNELAHAAAVAVSETPGTTYNPLVIYSGVGLGKTHLLHAIGHHIAQRGLSLIYATTEDFTNEYIKAIRERRTEDFRNIYRGADVLLLDDIQFLIGKEQTQEGFFHTFNALHMANRQIVITSDRPVSALTLLEDRIRSRLGGGLVVDIQAPDVETRLAILKAKAEATGEQFPPEVLQFLADRIHKNIRELEGSLNRVAAYAQLAGSPITVDLVRLAIADALNPPDRRRLSDREIIDAVASYFSVEVAALKGQRRDKSTALVRHVAMFLLREEANLGLATIGQLLGGKDHSTVLHGCNRIASQVNLDAHLRRDLINIRETLAQL